MSDPVDAFSVPTTHPPASLSTLELPSAAASTPVAGASGSTTTTGGPSTGSNALASSLDKVRVTVREEISRQLPPAPRDQAPALPTDTENWNRQGQPLLSLRCLQGLPVSARSAHDNNGWNEHHRSGETSNGPVFFLHSLCMLRIGGRAP